MRQRIWWRVPLLLLALLLVGGAFRTDTVAGLDFAPSGWSEVDPLASTIAAPATPARPGAARVQHLAPGHPASEPGPPAVDGVVADQPNEPPLRSSADRPPGALPRPVDLARPRLGRAPPSLVELTSS